MRGPPTVGCIALLTAAVLMGGSLRTTSKPGGIESFPLEGFRPKSLHGHPLVLQRGAASTATIIRCRMIRLRRFYRLFPPIGGRIKRKLVMEVFLTSINHCLNHLCGQLGNGVYSPRPTRRKLVPQWTPWAMMPSPTPLAAGALLTAR